MPVFYRWIMAVAGAMTLTAGLFAAMPVALRLHSPEAGEEIVDELPLRVRRPPRDLYANTVIMHPHEFSPSFHMARSLRQISSSSSSPSYGNNGILIYDDFDWPPSEDERQRRNTERFNEVMPHAALPTAEDVSIFPASLPGRDVGPYMHSPCFHSPQYPESALEVGLEGDVTVQFDVTSVGEITNIQIVESTHPVFAANVVRCMEAAHYLDAVAMQNVRKGFQFRLD